MAHYINEFTEAWEQYTVLQSLAIKARQSILSSQGMAGILYCLTEASGEPSFSTSELLQAGHNFLKVMANPDELALANEVQLFSGSFSDPVLLDQTRRL